MNIPTKKLRPDAILPTKAHATDAAFDLYLPKDHADVSLGAGQRHTFRLGIALAIPVGWMMKMEGRSGLASKGIQILGGIVDAPYRGEIGVIIRNSSEEPASSGAASASPRRLSCRYQSASWSRWTSWTRPFEALAGLGAVGDE